MTKSETPLNLPIFTKKRKHNYKAALTRLNYHTLRALGKVPTRYSIHDHNTDEHRTSSRNSRKARWNDPKHQPRIAHQNACYYQRTRNLMKQCSNCFIIREHAKFDLQHTQNTTQLRSYCKDCRKEMNATAYQRRLNVRQPQLQQLRCPRTGRFRHNEH